jgi:hypothetical protein
MINSLILQSYSPVIIPTAFIYAVNYIERGMLLGNPGLLGFFILLGSILIYYDRVHAKHKEYVLGGLILFYISYFMFLQLEKKILNSILMFGSLFLVAYGLTDLDVYLEKNQYIYFSLFMLFVSFTLLMPYERNQINPYNLSLISVALGITILVFTTVKTPVLK